jgi:hypothetical protein
MDELRDYFLGPERKMFEELSNVSLLLQWGGKDYNGLDVWLRFRGSNRAENVHYQKMSVTFLP